MLISKKIVHITTAHYYPDVRIFYKECMSLAQAGYQVTLITQADTAHVINNIKVVPLPFPKNRIDRITRILFAAFQLSLKEQADIYHFHDPELMLVAIALKLLGKKVIYDVHENVPEDIKVKPYLPKFLRNTLSYLIGGLEIFSAKLMDAIVTVTPKIAARFPQAKTFLVRNFPSQYEFSENTQPYLERDFIALYAGGINQVRGIKEMLGAMNLLPITMNVKLRLAGKFSSAQLQNQLMVHPAWTKVDYWGLVGREKLKEAFAAARIGLVLFHPDNNHLHAYPNKLFEYMSAGLPVIASDFPLWYEIVEKAQCGLLVDPKDEQAIADAIVHLLTYPEEAKQMGENGKNAILKVYSWENEANTLLSLYEKILSSE